MGAFGLDAPGHPKDGPLVAIDGLALARPLDDFGGSLPVRKLIATKRDLMLEPARIEREGQAEIRPFAIDGDDHPAPGLIVEGRPSLRPRLVIPRALGGLGKLDETGFPFADAPKAFIDIDVRRARLARHAEHGFMNERAERRQQVGVIL
jgi:hypothetical protein